MFSALLAFYHFGIEQGFFEESFVCSIENQSNILSKEQLLKELNKNIVSCKEVTFKILGLSLAAINTILSVLLSIIFLKLFFNYGSSSTSQYK
jgi:disulfide bond formation protein DsbB